MTETSRKRTPGFQSYASRTRKPLLIAATSALALYAAGPAVAQTAVRTLPEPVSVTAAQPAMATPPSVKATLPAGLVPVTVAVKVTVVPVMAGFDELASTVVVGFAPPAASSAAPASTMPAPHSAVVQSRTVPVGNGRAVVCRIDITCDGVSNGFLESILTSMRGAVLNWRFAVNGIQ